MQQEFSSRDAVAIEAGAPGVTRAPLAVSGVGDGAIAHLAVTVDLEHAWRGDLALSLLSPNGTRVVLARRRRARSSSRCSGWAPDSAITVTAASCCYRRRTSCPRARSSEPGAASEFAEPPDRP